MMNISLVILILLLAFFYLYCFVLITNTNVEPRENNTRRTHILEKKNLHAWKNFHVPKFMLELYERNKERDIARADVVRSLIPKHAGQLEGNEVFTASTSETHILVFDLPSADEDETLVCAELKVLTLVVSGEEMKEGVKRKLKLSTYGDYLHNLLGFQEVFVHHLNDTWLTFDLTRSVQEILASQSKVKYLTVTLTVSDFASDRKGRLRFSLMPEEENFEFEYPVLLLSYASSKDKKRIKRSAEDDYEEETNKLWDEGADRKYKKLKRMRNNCRRRPLYVDFAEINFDSWIVQPKGYEAFQCLGRCFYPVAEHLNPTKHAIVQALLHSVSPAKVARSCCVPTLLDSISILYVDVNGVLTYRYAYKDMVVVECGCR